MRLDEEDPFASYYSVTGETLTSKQLLRCDRTRTVGSTVICDSTNSIVSQLRRYGGRPTVYDETGISARGDTQHNESPSNDIPWIAEGSPTLSDLAGKRALILGDSVDRNMLYDLRETVLNDTAYFSGCDMDDSRVLQPFDGSQGAPRMMVIPIDRAPSEAFDFARDVDVNHSPSTVSDGQQVEDMSDISARALSQVRIDFLHMYGTDEEDLWEDRQSHHQVTAWRSKDRLEKVKSMWGTGPDTYSAVVINFGLWELARYQRTAYAVYAADDETGLPQEWLEDYKDRLRAYVATIRSTWSTAQVAIRTIHDPREGAGGWFRSANMDEGGVRSPPFTRLRVVQLRRAQLQVAEELGLNVLNWADHMIGQDASWLKDEIHPAVPGSLVLAEMYLRLLADTKAD